ncbi:MAG: RidA family protein [Planctomycetes bacterium]|nr:RidA family protein [Planctomycetota bacterium]
MTDFEKSGNSSAGNSNSIQRFGVTRRWSDAVVFNGTAHFVEVADDPKTDLLGQVTQILNQIDYRLSLVGSDRTRLLQVLIYIANLHDVAVLNSVWDQWVPEGHAPARACVQAGLAPGYLVEMVVTAAVKTS